MTKFTTFPSQSPKGSSLIQLTDFLSILPENNWLWSVLEFDGIGVAPNNLSIPDFEELIRLKPKGFIMTWAELKSFANSLVQTYDCLIVGALSLKDISEDRSDKMNFCNCEVVIEAFDCSEWSIWIRDQEIMERLTEFIICQNYNPYLIDNTDGFKVKQSGHLSSDR